MTTSISCNVYRDLACPCVKALLEILLVFCVRAGAEIDCRLRRRPSCDLAVSVVEKVVVKDNNYGQGFVTGDRARYQDVAHFLKDSAEFIQTFRRAFIDHSRFRPMNVGEAVLFVTL